MNWLEFTVYTSTEGTELLSGILLNHGIDEYVVEEGRELTERFLEENSANWDYADINEVCKSDEPSIRFYIDNSEESAKLIENLRAEILRFAEENPSIPLGSLKFAQNVVQDEDWKDNWKQYYKPFSVGNIMICPVWEETPELNGKQLLKLNPGLAFGTGLHETTRMCLESLERNTRRGCSLIDLGCGSGILTVAGKLWGAGDTLSIDIDPAATHSTKENGELNGMDLSVLTGNVIGDDSFYESIKRPGGYDVVVANIVAGVLIPLAPRVPGLLAPGGVFISSGIIRDRMEEVAHSYEAQGMTVTGTYTQGEWVVIEAKMR